MVPTVSPPIMVMAMEPYMGSPTRGIMPTMVVSDAIVTGLTRDTVASMTALYGCTCSSFCNLVQG